MRAAPRPESIGEAEKVGLIDRVHHLDRRALDELIFQRGDAQRPLPPVSLRDVRPLDRLRSIRPPLEPFGEVREVHLEGLPVLPPRLPVHARGRIPLQRVVRSLQALAVVDVVQERREPHLLVPFSHFPYPLQRTGGAGPTLCPERVMPGRVPLGQPPSLHPLRHRSPGLVRRLRRYYEAVRLPVPVHRWRVSMDFPTRPAALPAAGEHGLSRLSHEVCPNMLAV